MMVSRRKYKDGGRVPIPDDTMTPPPAPPPEASAPAADDSIARLLEQQQAAEMHAAQEQIERAPIARLVSQLQGMPPTIEQQIDAMPLSDHKKAFLRKHPEFVTVPSMRPVLAHYHQDAMARGIADDTEEMDQAIRDGCRIEHERLQRPANIAQTLQAATTPPPPTGLTPPPPPPPRSGPPVSAPVHRAAPSMSGAPVRPSRVELSREEREIAKASGISDEEYAVNKIRLLELKKSGHYQERG